MPVQRKRPVASAMRRPPADVRAAPARRHIVLLAVAVVVVYANSLANPLVLDDEAAIVQNPTIRSLTDLGAVLRPVRDSPVAGRPLVNLSFAINYAAGGLDPRGYRAWNMGVHLLCALLAFALIRHTLALPRVRRHLDADEGTLAFGAALLWAVHPLNSEVVNYLSQRTESMMAGCLLLAMYASARAIGQVPPDGTGPADAPPPAAWRWTAILVCALGALCKESIAIAPALVVLYDRVFVFDSWRQAIVSRRTLYLGLALTWVIVAAIVIANPRGSVAGFSSGVSAWTYLLNQTVMITEYLRLAFWPHSLVAFYGWPEALTVADVLPHGMLILGLLLATVVALVRAPVVGYAGAWFFITLAPASSIVPVATEVGAERRMYLPLLAIVVVVVVGASVVWRRISRAAAGSPMSGHGLAAGAMVLAVTSLALTAVTIARNREYATRLRLAETIVERRPTAVSRHMLAEQLVRAGRHDEALDHLRQAVAGGNSRAGHMLGITLLNRGEIGEAIQRLEAFLGTAGVPQFPRWLEPPITEVVTARVAIGVAYLRQQDWARADAQADAIRAVAPRHPDAHLIRAGSLFGQERWADAIPEFRAYLAARPRDTQALMNLGIALVATARFDDAVATFRRAVEIDPSDERARRLLALAEADRAAGR